jgi:glycosyltransferase involved in cell wall biosynthesis
MVNKKAVVFIVNHMNFGGCQKIVYDLIKGIPSSHFDVYLIADSGHFSNLLLEETEVVFFDRKNNSILSIKKIINEIQNRHAKIILHSHNRIDILFKYFLRSNDSHLHTFHSAYLNKNYLYKFLKPQKSISISKTVQSYLNKYSIENEMIYNGVELNGLIHLNDDEVLRNPRILYIGRVTKEKGFELLLERLIMFSKKYSGDLSLELNVVGDGEEIEKYKQTILNSKTDFKVDFKGFLSNPWENVNDYDLIIIPSYFEGFCLVAAEGAAVGIPIIGNDILALREVLSFLSDTSFFDIFENDTFDKALYDVIYNYGKQKELAFKNIDFIKEKFSKNIMINKYLKIYESISK